MFDVLLRFSMSYHQENQLLLTFSLMSTLTLLRTTEFRFSVHNMNDLAKRHQVFDVKDDVCLKEYLEIITLK